MRLHMTVRATVMGLFLSLLATGEAKAVTFSFTTIADASTFSSIDSPLFTSPSINDNGTVAFRATDQQFSPSGRFISFSGIFTGNGEQITTILSYDLTPFSFYRSYSSPVISNTGTVAFDEIFGVPRGRATIVSYTAGEIVRSPSFESEGIGNLAINDSTTVVFISGNFPVFQNILVSNAEQLTNLTSYTADSFRGTSINNAGTVAFSGVNTASFDPNRIRPFEVGIFTTSSSGGGVVTPVVLEDNTFGRFGNLSLNDQGTVAFVADRSPEGAGIFTKSTNGALTSIANTSGVFNSFGAVSLNEQGTIAFEAGLDAGGEGIFIGPDPVNDKVITTGDSLLGSTVTNLAFLSAGLNNSQQIAFLATLANGNTGIFRAEPQATEPQSVPEFTSVLGLLAFGAFGAGSMLKRKEKKQLNSAS